MDDHHATMNPVLRSDDRAENLLAEHTVLIADTVADYR